MSIKWLCPGIALCLKGRSRLKAERGELGSALENQNEEQPTCRNAVLRRESNPLPLRPC
jgi:hypothetical protein